MPSSAPTAGRSPSSATTTCYVVDVAAPDGAGPDHRAGRETLRHGDRRLGLLRGDLQPPLAGVLVEPRLEADRLHGIRRRAAWARSRCSTTPGVPRKVEQNRYPRSGEPNPKVRLGIVDARRRAGAVGRPVGLLGRRVPDQPRRLVARQLRGLLLRPGPDPDLARPGQDSPPSEPSPKAQRAVPRHDQGLDRRPGADHLPQGRLVPLDQRAGRLEAPLPLRGRRDPQGPGHRRASGRSARSPTSIPNRAGSTSRRPATPRWRPNLYRVKLGGPIERLTQGPGSHQVSLSPDGQLLPGDLVRPQRPRRRSGCTRPTARSCGRSTPTPCYRLKEYRFGPRERVQIPTKDGFLLEARADPAAGPRPAQEVPRLVHDLRRARTRRRSATAGRAAGSGTRPWRPRGSSSSTSILAAPAARGPSRPGRRTSSWACRSSRTSRTGSPG